MNESPDYVQISTAAAMTLKIFPGQFNRGEKLYALNLLVVNSDGCRARCGYCGLSKSRDGNEKSFIRVDWPIVPLDDVIKRTNEHGSHLKRVCVSMITHPKAFEDMCTIMQRIRDGTGLPISGLISPTVITKQEMMVEIKNSGADMVGIAIDTVTPELFDEMRGSGVRGPHDWDHYWKVLEWAVECFGPDKAGIHLIVGLGETEKQMVSVIQKAEDMGVKTHLFSFFPEEGSGLEDLPQPTYGHYRRIQLARYLINNGLDNVSEMTFNEKDQIVSFGADIEPVIDDGEAFMTSGCPGNDGQVACNRPYGNERPSRPIRNFAFHPEPDDILTIRQQLFDYS